MKKLVLALTFLFAATSVSMAGTVAVDLTLDQTTIDILVAMDLGFLGYGNDSKTTTANVSGTTKMNLDMEIDPYTHVVSSISAMEFVQELLTGPIQVSDFSVTLELIPGNLNVDGVSIGGTLYTSQDNNTTPDDMSPVTGNTSFPGEEQYLGLDQGSFELTGLMEQPWPLNVPGGMAYSSQDRLGGTIDGTVVVGSPTIVGNEAMYDVNVTLPLDWLQPIWNPNYVPDGSGGPASLGELTATGTLIMSGTITTTLPIPGDANLNGVVDAEDAAFMADHWLEGPNATWAMGDFTGDGYVNDDDVTLLAANWSGAGSPPASVPEPTSLAALLAVALAGLTLWRRR